MDEPLARQNACRAAARKAVRADRRLAGFDAERLAETAQISKTQAERASDAPVIYRRLSAETGGNSCDATPLVSETAGAQAARQKFPKYHEIGKAPENAHRTEADDLDQKIPRNPKNAPPELVAEQDARRAAALDTAHADERFAALQTETSAESAGSAQTSNEPAESRSNPPSDSHAETCPNLPKPLTATQLPCETTADAGGPAERAERAETEKSPGNPASDGPAILGQKVAETARNSSSWPSRSRVTAAPAAMARHRKCAFEGAVAASGGL